VAGWWWLAWIREFAIGEAERLENGLQLIDFLLLDLREVLPSGVGFDSPQSA
jgi:hypothetical protein